MRDCMSSGNSFPDEWPPHCPPDDAVDASITVYRTVKADPPTEEDFLSYRELGKKVAKHLECDACGISVMRTKADAVHHRNLFQWSGVIAEGVLQHEHGKIKDTPSNKFPSHL